MKVIMLADVKSIGKKGECVEVKDGYGSNYLIPHKLAVRYTDRSVEILAEQKKKEEEKIEELRITALKSKEILAGITLEFTAKAANDGRMCGTISFKQIEAELKNKYNIIVDKRKIVEKFPVNAFGVTVLKIDLYKGIIGEIKVHVGEQK